MTGSEELQQRIDDLDAKLAELAEAEAAADSGSKKDDIGAQRWRIEVRRRSLARDLDQALASHDRHEVEAKEIATLRTDNADAVADLESDVASTQAEADRIVARLDELDTEAKTLFARLRGVEARASELYPQCEKWGVTPVHVALTDAIQNYHRLGVDYRL